MRLVLQIPYTFKFLRWWCCAADLLVLACQLPPSCVYDTCHSTGDETWWEVASWGVASGVERKPHRSSCKQIVLCQLNRACSFFTSLCVNSCQKIAYKKYINRNSAADVGFPQQPFLLSSLPLPCNYFVVWWSNIVTKDHQSGQCTCLWCCNVKISTAVYLHMFEMACVACVILAEVIYYCLLNYTS